MRITERLRLCSEMGVIEEVCKGMRHLTLFSNIPLWRLDGRRHSWGRGEAQAALCGLDQGKSNIRLLDSNAEDAAGLSVEREGKESSGASPVFGA